jgi:DNA repair protein RadC
MHTTMFTRFGTDYRPATDAEILEAAAFLAARKMETARVSLSAPADAQTFLVGQLRHCEEEHFCVIFLDSRHGVIAFEKMFRGTIDGSAVHPREVVKAVLAKNAAAVILAHNHPSGVAEPSVADEQITQHLVDALGLIEVRVLDHIIVGSERCLSFAERGLL